MSDQAKDAAQPPKLSLHSAVPSAEKRRQLKQLFPEAFDETQAIDFEKLKSILGEFLESNGERRERYGLTWPGKNQCLKILQQASAATLKPCRKDSVRFDSSDNLFIEGDNLEVLKLLQKTYFGKIQSIYIDPPYNTGKDFIYKDNWKMPLREYLRQTGQLDANGRRVENAETNGRKHSNWLNMMYPRLYLARQLLSEDGAIFISIDDHEVHNLRHLCDEIFGQENFIAQISWQGMDTIKNDAQRFSENCEYVLCYAKNIDEIKIPGLPKTEKQRKTYKNYDNDPRGDYLLTPLHGKTGTEESNYEFTFPNGQKWKAPTGRHPIYSAKRLQEMVNDGRILLDPDGKKIPQKKTFWSEASQTMRPTTFWPYKNYGSTRQANAECRALLGRGIAENPKPVRLIEHLLRLGNGKDSLVLDFFVGSCTTAHAVMKLNKEDGGKRRFIMIQLPERCPEKSEAFKAGYKTIADIGKERICRAAQQLNDESGFQVFKLDQSNFKVWDDIPTDDVKEIQKRIQLQVNNLNPKSSKEEVLYELLLKAGYPLTTRIEKKDMAGTKVYSVDNGKLFLCLEKNLTFKSVRAMAKAEPQEVICLDRCFAGNDELKTNAYYHFKCRGRVIGHCPEIIFRTV